MDVAIVKYNAGNIYSVIHALKRLGISPILTDDAELLSKADRVLFPGQGEASTAMAYLRERGLDQVIKDLRQPVLGICIGQQLMCRHSEEGDTDCLGIFQLDVKRFQPQRHTEKVPQMGWNSIQDLRTPLFREIEDGSYIYNIHSYYVPYDKDFTIATCNYIQPYSAALHWNNFYATQFHPEKSGNIGEKILKNFLEL
ncbi:MAG: imidazole glycerol phosphate synthase subunit HisH [Bacteroides sp.]|nr:imidazole glycerol phosphate synthase subunit HisH [Bacteroides sp.]MCM1447011.1 imidazole glycerol phosphate synthase subunit HisH [Bacteroides sp.]MCM1515021.1 imidazole glycerol phosphate synthase subunit HisH [Paraprevotella sp.]